MLERSGHDREVVEAAKEKGGGGGERRREKEEQRRGRNRGRRVRSEYAQVLLNSLCTCSTPNTALCTTGIIATP